MTISPDHQENQATSQENKSTSDKEFNFSQMRKQLEQERAFRQQAEERAAKLEQEYARARTSTNADDDDYSDEPYVDHRMLDKKLKRWSSDVDKKIDERAEEKARSLIEQERKQLYLKNNSDFAEVMNPEIITKFAEKYPQLAEGILALPDGFERQKVVYETIKAVGAHKNEEPKPSIQETIDKNRKSPFYKPSGVGNAPYAAVGDFSPAGQKSAYEKLQQLKSGLRL